MVNPMLVSESGSGYKPGMKLNDVQKFVALRASLLTEKAELEQRLAQIKEALSGEVPSPVAAPPPVARKQVKRVKNVMSLNAAVRQVTRAKASTKPEILAAIDKLGYRFATKEPVGSLNSVLYAKGQFKNDNGRFSPAK